jgi:hypothetical protein
VLPFSQHDRHSLDGQAQSRPVLWDKDIIKRLDLQTKSKDGISGQIEVLGVAGLQPGSYDIVLTIKPHDVS